MSNDKGLCQDYTLDNFIETVRVFYYYLKLNKTRNKFNSCIFLDSRRSLSRT